MGENYVTVKRLAIDNPSIVKYFYGRPFERLPKEMKEARIYISPEYSHDIDPIIFSSLGPYDFGAGNVKAAARGVFLESEVNW